MKHQTVVVLDFGGQYNQLIARRVRECGVYCEVKPYTTSIEALRAMNPIGIIFTGGPNSVYDPASPQADPELFRLGVPILTVLALELAAAYLCLRSIRVRRLLCGVPILLIWNGEVCQKNLRRTRINADELTEHLRESGYLSPAELKYAILETNGQISTFPYGRCRPPVAKESGIQADDPLLPYTLISDGRILSHNLAAAGRDRRWLEETLRRLGCRAEDLFLLTADDAGTLYAARKEQAP